MGKIWVSWKKSTIRNIGFQVIEYFIAEGLSHQVASHDSVEGDLFVVTRNGQTSFTWV